MRALADESKSSVEVLSANLEKVSLENAKCQDTMTKTVEKSELAIDELSQATSLRCTNIEAQVMEQGKAIERSSANFERRA